MILKNYRGINSCFWYSWIRVNKLYKKGLKIEIKEDGSPVSNGDLKVNDLISKKIKELTPEIPIISEETVNIKEK